ncbi:MAG: DegT/DnrJ/EryC1/StrS family aminotransferase [Candidatus Bathyarchaeota archaeon]|nr:DegT/DnrJ/EryC1/StrS family aminotransferase [Candidatus Bathyarchaeota archaeon]
MNRKIPIAKPEIGTEEMEAVKEVLESGMLVQGQKVKELEEKFAEYIGVEHAVAVSNGTVALDVALKALDIGPGDEVITSAFSFIASGNCILFQNAKPVFADIDPKTFNIDPSDVAEKITSKTKAIIPIHIFGQPAKMDAINEIAEDKGIFVVEDAAQAHGAEYKGQKAGSMGTMGCFSLYATKNMMAGEGGIITSNNQKLADKMRLIRSHGEVKKYTHEILGYNYRMTNLNASIGVVQLKKLEKFNEKRIENAKLLSEGIDEITGLTAPYVDSDVKHVFHQYVLRVENEFSMNRDELSSYLPDRGVGVAVHYPIPIYKQPLYQKLGYNNVKCPNTEDACNRVLSLPVHPQVSKDDIDYIISTLHEFSS